MQNEYNSAIGATDIAVIDEPKICRFLREYLNIKIFSPKVLIGRKPTQDKFRFVGGFVEGKINGDMSYEEGALRELSEEAPLIISDGCEYIGSRRVDDPRYRENKDKIFTAFFATYYISGEAIAGDDLKEVTWYNLADIYYSDVMPEHRPLLSMLKKKFLYV